MRSHRFIQASIAIGLLTGGSIQPESAGAYTGGPALVEILGWEESQSRLYVWAHAIGESWSFGEISYFDLSDSDPHSRVRAPWNDPTAARDDHGEIQALDSLRAHLTELGPIVGAAFPQELSVAHVDSVETTWGVRPEYRLLMKYESGLSFEVISGRPAAVVKDIYALPGDRGYLYVLAFSGNVAESMLAETQVPVLVLPHWGPGHIREVKWERRW